VIEAGYQVRVSWHPMFEQLRLAAVRPRLAERRRTIDSTKQIEIARRKPSAAATWSVIVAIARAGGLVLAARGVRPLRRAVCPAP
jgi:hypothetical protein